LDNDLYQEAEELAESRLSNQPEDIDAKVILCQAWMRTGRIHKVKAMLRDVEEVITDLSGSIWSWGICAGRRINAGGDPFLSEIPHVES